MHNSPAKVLVFATVLVLAFAGQAMFFYKVFEETYPYNGWFPGFFIDFKNTWFAAWSWWNGELLSIFDAADFNFGMRRFFALEGGHIWSYPLHYLMLALPFGALPFPAAALLWTVLGLVAWFTFLEKTMTPSRTVLLLILMSGGFLNTMAFGQVTFFAAILLVGGLRVMPTRPILAGVLFGLLTMKPHFGILLPVVLLSERRWSTIASACVTAAVLVAASVAVMGMQAWESSIHVGMPEQTEAMLERAPLWAWEPNWYAFLRALLVPVRPALAVQAVCAAFSVAALLALKRAGVPEDRRHELVPLLTLFALPYVLPSDMVLVAPLLAARVADPRTPVVPFAFLSSALLMSGFFFVTARLTHTPLFPLAFTASVLWIVRQTWREAAPAASATPSPKAEPAMAGAG